MRNETAGELQMIHELVKESPVRESARKKVGPALFFGEFTEHIEAESQDKAMELIKMVCVSFSKVLLITSTAKVTRDLNRIVGQSNNVTVLTLSSLEFKVRDALLRSKMKDALCILMVFLEPEHVEVVRSGIGQFQGSTIVNLSLPLIITDQDDIPMEQTGLDILNGETDE